MVGQFKVVCATCQIEPKIISDANGDGAICPRCGQRDDLEDASRIAGEHFLQSAIPDIQKDLGVAFSGKFTSFEAKRVTKRTFRWHAVPI